MKKKLLSIAAAVIVLVSSAPPAIACAPCHGGTKAASYSVCAVKSCDKTGLHKHSGKTYAAHYYGDGHNYHAYCADEDCTIAGYHEHDGSYCFAHSLNDGHDYHNARRSCR